MGYNLGYNFVTKSEKLVGEAARQPIVSASKQIITRQQSIPVTYVKMGGL